MIDTLNTVVELQEFIRAAERAGMTEAERAVAVITIAQNPEAGVSLGGGLRKVRIPRTGKGKRGGYRTIHFFYDDNTPVFMISVLAKNQKDNFTKKELAAMAAAARVLLADYRSAK